MLLRGVATVYVIIIAPLAPEPPFPPASEPPRPAPPRARRRGGASTTGTAAADNAACDRDTGIKVGGNRPCRARGEKNRFSRH